MVIHRRGVPQAVLLSYEQYRRQFSGEEEPAWRLCGSIQASPDVDIDDAIAVVRRTTNKMLGKRRRAVGSLFKP